MKLNIPFILKWFHFLKNQSFLLYCKTKLCLNNAREIYKLALYNFPYVYLTWKTGMSINPLHACVLQSVKTGYKMAVSVM